MLLYLWQQFLRLRDFIYLMCIQEKEFRHTSVTVPVCNGQVVGLGLKGYLYAMEAVVDLCYEK
ncbi:MAG: type II 3-dehydroquinate dehydratase [Lachnospira eligens]